MSKKTETERLQRLSLESDGYIASPCKVCGWWHLTAGNEYKFNQDYCPEIQCKCSEVRGE